MGEKKDENLSVEVEARLENLFDDSDDVEFEELVDDGDDSSIDEEEQFDEVLEEELLVDDVDEELMDDPVENPGDTEHGDVEIKESGDFEFYPFRLLKAIILSIDWEITDDVMGRFIDQLTRLKETYKEDTIILVFLQLLWELGQYIKKNRGKSHPNSIKTLNSIYNALEKVVSDKALTDADKKKILAKELDGFKKLKHQIESPKLPDSEDNTRDAEKSDEMLFDKPVSEEMVEVIRAVVREELKAFMKELGEWASKR